MISAFTNHFSNEQRANICGICGIQSPSERRSAGRERHLREAFYLHRS